MKKIKKGNYQYFFYKKRIEVLKTILYFALSFAIFLIGYLTTGSKGNLLTVVAILGCLPASKSAVSMIMYLKTKEVSADAHQAITEHVKNLEGYFDLYFTSYDKNFSISHLVVTQNSIMAFCEKDKIDEKAFLAHLKQLLAKEGLKNITIKLFTEQSRYLQRLDEMNEGLEDLSASKAIVSLLFSVSL